MSDYTYNLSEHGGGSRGVDIPEGWYTAKFLGVVADRKWPIRDKETGEVTGESISLTCQWVIDDPESEHHGSEFRDFIPLDIYTNKKGEHSKSKRQWAALLGIDPNDLVVAELPKSSWFTGKCARVKLRDKESKSTGAIYPEINIFRPVEDKKRRPVRDVVEEEYDDDAPNF